MSKFQIIVGVMFVLCMLFGVSAMAAFAQGPTPVAPPAVLTPAAAPPAVAAINLDDPARAATLGSPIPSLPAHSAEWFQFPYDNGGNFPRPTVTIRLVNGVTNGLRFEVWSPERMAGGWFNNDPVGKGSQEVVVNCANPQTTTDSHGNVITTNKCETNDLGRVGSERRAPTGYV